MGVAQSPTDTVSVLEQRAETLRREKRLEEARGVYRILVDRDPHDFQDGFWLAKLDGWTGHLETAESIFVALLHERPDDYDSRIGLADVLLWQGRYDAAEAELRTLERTRPGDAEVLYRLGRVQEARGDPRGARRNIERALRIDPGHAEAQAALRRLRPVSQWEMGIDYYGDQLSNSAGSNGGTASIGAQPGGGLRWRAAATVQQKFARTEARVGGELTHRLFRFTELHWSAYVAPGAEVLPRQSYGIGAIRNLGAGLVLYADYSFLDFADAQVHQISPRLELYAGPHWLLSGRYAYSSTSFDGLAEAVGNHAGSVSLGYVYGGSNLLQGFAGAGGESFALPSRDAIGGFSAHTFGIGWRQFVTPWLGLTAFYAHQNRSDGAKQDSYGLGLMRRW